MTVSILGGEPSLYKDIIPLIKAIDNLNIKFTMTTNGVNMSNELINAIVNSKNMIPVFSIQSLDKLNEKLMGVSFEVQLNNLKKILSKNKKCRINTVYTTQNKKQIFKLIDFCLENKIDRYSIGYYVDLNETNTIENKKNLMNVKSF